MFKPKSIKSLSVLLTVSMVLGILCSLITVTVIDAAPGTLTNPNASQEAKNVYNYVLNMYGKGILAGQQESTWVNNNPDDEMDYIENISGKLPAIRGLDYINNDFSGVNQRATEWWNKGGIPTICWHWGAPTLGVGYEASKLTIDVNQALTPGTELNKAMLADMDRTAEALKKLRDANVPVLWRPFHEFDGAWFWWGKGGPEAFKKLWILMYDRFTNTHKLNNLIWVLGYSGEVKSGWYPGDAYVDIAGADTYSTGTQNGLYNKVRSIVGNEMPICYHENGSMPDPDAMIADGTKWVWFMTWHTIHIKQQNTADFVRKVYNHNYVITLDEVPNLKNGSVSPSPSPTPSAPPSPLPTGVVILEAENGVLTSTTKSTAVSGYSGSGYVTGFTEDASAVTVNANISTAGIYNISIGYRAPYGEKTCSLQVNNVPSGDVVLAETATFAETSAGKIQLNTGNNSIKIVKNWGWYEIDYIKILPAASTPREHQVTGILNNPNATKEAKSVMSYLTSVYGKKILSGQQDYSNFEWIKQNTGKSPAIFGTDFMDYSPSRVARGTTSTEVEKAISWWQQGGLVTFCWHWNAPTGLIDQPGKEWWRGFYTDSVTFDVETAINNPGSENYNLLVRDIDAIAVQLKRLQDEGVPVIWRPLHEAGGGWFWWGAKGAEPCKKLYLLMYDRLTNYHKLNNLIWVWSTPEEAWYPGDQYVDIVGFDSYPQPGDYNPAVNMYDHYVNMVSDKKIAAMTENGPIPDPEKLAAFHADWSWFCTWSGFVSDGSNNSLEHVKKVYASDYVITLDELPKFTDIIPQPTPSIISDFTYGDVDGNGSVNSIDFAYMRMRLLGMVEGFTYVNGEKAADVNGDGTFNSIDFAYMRMRLLGMIDSFPAESKTS